ncbi:glycine cleavage T-protein barrel domain protein, partial [Actinomyces johnsonii F0542]
RRAREADARAIPHELDWLRTAVHLTKGCYPGQETIARTLNLGRPPRRLAVLQLDGLGGGLPQPGASVRMGERTVGAVTSVARHHELGPIALALLRRAVPAGEQLTVEITEVDEATGETIAVGRVDAAQELLVSPEGRAQASPAERPGAGLRKGLRL